jgi:hypothetical protein
MPGMLSVTSGSDAQCRPPHSEATWTVRVKIRRRYVHLAWCQTKEQAVALTSMGRKVRDLAQEEV